MTPRYELTKAAAGPRFRGPNEAKVWIRSAKRGFLFMGLAQLVVSVMTVSPFTFALALLVLGAVAALQFRLSVGAAAVLAVVSGLNLLVRGLPLLAGHFDLLALIPLAVWIVLAWLAFRAWQATQYLLTLPAEPVRGAYD